MAPRAAVAAARVVTLVLLTGAARAQNDPRPVGHFCPLYHPITSYGPAYVLDPSGPLRDEAGLWHLWEDRGNYSSGWSHWTSTDLMHWNGSLDYKTTTEFTTMTGSVSPTPSGTYAMWPDGDGIHSAVATDATLARWQKRPKPVLEAPPGISPGNFRDPARAFEWRGRWFVPVGCGGAKGATLCLFEASDDTLADFKYVGTPFTINHTFGHKIDTTMEWYPGDNYTSMLECPDLFPLGEQWVLLGSFDTPEPNLNQWWVGDLVAASAGDDVDGPPFRFVPKRVGQLDFGNFYAGKSGSGTPQTADGRRLLFGFNGWHQPTMAPNCDDCRSITLPRELKLLDDGYTLGVAPVAEVAHLRVPGSRVDVMLRGATPSAVPVEVQARQRGAAGEGTMEASRRPAGRAGKGEEGGEGEAERRRGGGGEASRPAAGRGATLAAGAQIEARVRCGGVARAAAAGASGVVGLRTLSTADGGQFTEIGYDFGRQAFYADHRKSNATPNAIVQRAPLPLATLLEADGQELSIAIFVDGGIIEAFAADRIALTALSSPDPAYGAAADRQTVLVNSVGQLNCSATSYQLAY